MIGRAAVGRPWLVGQVADELAGRVPPELSPACKAALAIEHYEGLLAIYGRNVGLRHARKHLTAYADEAARFHLGLRPAERLRLVTSEEPREVVRLLERLFAEPRDGSLSLAEAA